MKLAREVVERTPDSPLFLNTLGVAQYRNGLYPEAIATLKKSLELGRGQFEAFDLFFLAMAYHRLGDLSKARDCHDRAVRWIQSRTNLAPHQIEDLKAFQSESEAILRSAISPSL